MLQCNYYKTYRQQEVAAYMYFAIITFSHILQVPFYKYMVVIYVFLLEEPMYSYCQSMYSYRCLVILSCGYPD